VHKVTIVPHRMALGVTEQRPKEDRYNLSRPYLMARLAVMLGGRSGEEIAIGEITTGAENDLLLEKAPLPTTLPPGVSQHHPNCTSVGWGFPASWRDRWCCNG
jgi:hypothetical protein